MTDRIDLTVDKQSRVSVGRLGFAEGHVVAEELPDGSGWVLRPAVLMTQAELDVIGHPENRAALERALEDVAQGRTRPGYRR